ncbi:MAG: MFS transporter [Lachnospiraceae bacterium]|nr:MFS transporter [Lachnospiraceae bacterium]
MNSKLRTFQYTIINVAYFAAYSGVHAYAAVFLLDKGFTNTMIGVVIAMANILSVLLQPVAASFIDKYTGITNRKVSILCALGCMACCISLYFVTGIAMVFGIYVLLFTLQMVYQPLIQALSFEYNAMGDGINFGLARGLGSCGFAVTSAIIGTVLGSYGISSLQIINVIAFLVGILMMFAFTAPKNADIDVVSSKTSDGDVDEAHGSFISFVKYYPMFMLFVVGGTFLFYEHNALNDYLIQIITPLGGDESIMGNMVMVAAFLELPAMAGFVWLEKKFGVFKILAFSGIMFTVKTVLMLLASNLIMVYLSQACQIFAYALFIPGGAYLAEKVMNKADKTKGQAYINVCITLGGVFSALVCGRVLDVLGVHAMLVIATVIGVIGTLISIFAIGKIGKKVSNKN